MKLDLATSRTDKAPCFLSPVAMALAALLVCAPAAAQSSGARAAGATSVAGRILVMPRAGLPEAVLTKVLGENGGGIARRVGKSDLRIVEVASGQASAVVARLARHPHIKFAEVDRIVNPNLAGNDPYLGSEWHISKIGADTAWDSSLGSTVTIAIIDTGVDSTHPDLAGRFVAGWNFYDNNSNTADVYGHGTKVAGTAAATFNNGAGVAGIAGDAKIMPIRISSTTGSATLSAMAQALTWAADNGARVANISYLCADSSSVLSAASYFKSKGGLVTTAAGNYSVEEAIPATSAMIPVSSVDSNDLKATSSSYGAYVSMSAPGVGIYTTTSGGGYASVSGTSFASPVTAGTIALMMSANTKLANTDVEKLLFSTAVDLGTAGRDTLYGYGRVNAAAGVQAALSAVSSTDTTAPTVSISAPLGSSTASALVPVNVNAADDVGVSKVELRVNGSLVATDTAAPYAFSWDSTKVANGMASLVARACDAAGNCRDSAAVSVNVANTVIADTTPPTVAISNPTNGATVSGNTSVTVSAADDSGAAALTVALFINGSRVASSTGSGSLKFNWNTRRLASGTYALRADAKDAVGNLSSTSVIVTVKR